MEMKRKIMGAILAMALCLGMLPAPGAALAEQGEDITTGLVGYWTFDGANETEMLTNHAEGSNITITREGSTIAEADTGIRGGAAHFNQQANSPLKMELVAASRGLNTSSADFTLSAWVQYFTDMAHNQLVDLFQQTGDGRTMLYLKSDLTYGTYLAAANVTMSNRAAPLGSWHHVTITWDHTAKKLACYMNGVLEKEETLSGNPANAATDILIGCNKDLSAVGQTMKGHVDELRYYDRKLTADQAKAVYTYGNYHRPKPVSVTVDAGEELRTVTPAMFGINHRYHKNGYGTWDPAAHAISENFAAVMSDTKFGSVRWPGGTVSNLFTWKDSIGPLQDRTPTIPGNNFYSDAGEIPVEPGFGLDEAAKWIRDDLGAEMIYVYGMGRGSAQDAADLVEYLNAPNDGSNPGGGTDWAAVRAANGHPEPYNVTKFEIGNEFGDTGQNYWATPRGSGVAAAVEDYISGGTKTFRGETTYYQHNDRVVKKGDWRKSAGMSNGQAGQEFYLCYTPAVAGSVQVYVDGVEWTVVSSLAEQGAVNACAVDPDTGRITFGDGVHGNIPANGKYVTAHYSSPRDGFAAYYDAMKAVAEEIPGLDIKIYCGIFDGILGDFINAMHTKGYDDKYDGVIYHPYSGTQYNETNYNNCLVEAKNKSATIGSFKTQMDTVSGFTDKEVAVSEFGINVSTAYATSLGNAIYCANHMIFCLEAGAAYQNRHCLVDFTQGDNLGAWQQCVVQCLGNPTSTVSENNFVVTPSAHMFTILNEMTGGIQVANQTANNETYAGTVEKATVYTTKDDAGNVYVFIINNQQNDTLDLTIALKDEDLTGRAVEQWTLTSANVTDANTASEPQKVTIQKSQTQAEGESLAVTLAAHSINSFKITAGTIEVSGQTGELTYGSAGTATFTATARDFSAGTAFVPAVEWVTQDHEGVSISVGTVEHDAAVLTVTTTATANAGEYKFKIKSGAVESGEATLTIAKAPCVGESHGLNGVSAVDCTAAADNDGALANVTALMEYRKEGGEDWTDCPEGTLTGLEAGTWYVRIKESGNYLPSEARELTIAPSGNVAAGRAVYDPETGNSTVALAVSAAADLSGTRTVIVARFVEETHMAEAVLGTLDKASGVVTVKGKDLTGGAWRVFLLGEGYTPVHSSVDVPQG